MFPDCHEFTIQGGTFNEAQTQHFNYNIIIIQDKKAQSVEDLEKHWRTVISAVDPTVLNKKEDDESTDENSEDKNDLEDETTEDENFEDNKTKPPKQLFIYTGVDKASKKLKRPTDLVLTLTPATSDDGKSLPTIVWKTLHFEKRTAMYTQVIWSDEVGFCDLKEKSDGTLLPGSLKNRVKPGYSVILKDMDGSEDFEDVFKIPNENDHIGVCNTTNSRKRFALCTIDPTKAETDQFSPVVDLDQLTTKFAPNIKSGFQCGPPIMLQAYDISGYEERKPIDTTKLRRPLFVNATSKPQAIDMSKLGQVTTFRLYSKDSGRNVLEKE